MNEWRTVKLGSVLPFKYGKGLPDRERSHSGEYAVVSSAGFIDSHSEPLTTGPTVVIGRKGSIGSVFFSAEPVFPIDTTFYVEGSNEVDIRFSYYLLKSLQLPSMNTDAAVPGLRREYAELIDVTIPSVRRQEQIAEVLSSIDDLIENNRRRVQLLEEMARAIYREWFVKFRYPGHESVTPIGSVLGLIPQGWEVMAASKAVTINPKIKVDKTVEHPFITMGDLDEQSMVCIPSEIRTGSSGAKFEDGDTLFARITPCLQNGKTGFVQGIDEIGLGSTEFIVLRGDKVGPVFTYCLARSDDFRDNAIASMTGASGRQRVRNESFDSFQIAVPPRDVADAFEAIGQPLFEEVALLSRQGDELAALRDTLLPKLVTGQIDVTQLNLDDVLEGEKVA